MDFQQLLYFESVARLGSMNSAAKELHISQPSISVSIRKLEEELGIPLFDRVNGRLRLNAAGEAFSHRANYLMSEFIALKRRISSIVENATETVTIGTNMDNLCSAILEKISLENPKFQINYYVHYANIIQQNLEDGKIDFGILNAPLLSPSLTWTELARIKLYVLCSSKSALAERPSISMCDLKSERFILERSAVSSLNGLYHRLFAEAKFTPNGVFMSNDFTAMLHLIKGGAGISIVNEAETLNLPENDFAFIPLSDAYATDTIGISCLSGHYLSDAAKLCLDEISRYFRQWN